MLFSHFVGGLNPLRRWWLKRRLSCKINTMINLAITLSLLLVTLGLSGCSSLSGSQLATAPDNQPLQVETQGASEDGQLALGPHPSLEAVQGQALFQNHCAGCHPGGQNRQNAAKPVLGSQYLATLKGFTQYLRNPGPGMQVFSPSDLPDAQAKLIYQALQLASHSQPVSKG
jgi:cytochrome c6